MSIIYDIDKLWTTSLLEQPMGLVDFGGHRKYLLIFLVGIQHQKLIIEDIRFFFHVSVIIIYVE